MNRKCNTVEPGLEVMCPLCAKVIFAKVIFSVVDGRVVYELMSGSGGGNGVVLKSNKRIDDGQRYIIQASRDSTTVTLTVADKGDGDTVDKAIPSGMTLTGLHDGDGLLIGEEIFYLL